jgi:hypothetical protein
MGVLDEWFFAELTNSARNAKSLIRLKRKREEALWIPAGAPACLRVQCDASKAAQADAASPECCLQRSTPAVMNQIACPSTTRPKPCTLSRICPERTPTMVRGPRIQP